MGDQYTDYEKRIRALEQRVNDLAAALASVNMLAQQAAQDSGQQQPDQQTQTMFHVITTTDVSARVGTTMGSGSFQPVNGSDGDLTTITGEGTYTGYTDSKTGWAAGVYCRVTWMDGQWEFITADAC